MALALPFSNVQAFLPQFMSFSLVTNCSHGLDAVAVSFSLVTLNSSRLGKPFMGFRGSPTALNGFSTVNSHYICGHPTVLVACAYHWFIAYCKKRGICCRVCTIATKVSFGRVCVPFAH